jgi:hypothetical protein
MQKLSLNPDPQLEQAPDSTVLDYAMTAAKVGMLALPFIGPGITLMDLLTAHSRGKRMTNWCEELRIRLNDLSQRVEGLGWERLEKDEAFFSAFAQATQAATKTHQQGKREALRNAVLNVALGKEPDSNRQHQFFALIDGFSETHLAVLKLLNDPSGYFQLLGQKAPQLNHVKAKMLVSSLVGEAFPSLNETSEDLGATAFQFIELLLDDLAKAHLVRLERHQETWVVPVFAIQPGGGPIFRMATHLGESFLAFITEP